MGRVVTFTSPVVAKTFESGHRVLRIYTHEDMQLLSTNGGGCAYAHTFWTETVKPPIEHFFVMEKDNEISTILFTKLLKWNRKRHPRDGELRSYGYNYSKARNGLEEATSSTSYDRNPRSVNELHSDEIKRAEIDLRYARENLDYYKRLGVREHGPLHKDHPYKQMIDHANRAVSSCKSVLDLTRKMQHIPAVSEGCVFTWRRKKLIVLQVIGIGGSYLRQNSDEAIRWSQFCYPKGMSDATTCCDS